MSPPNAPTESLHSLPDQRWCAQASERGDRDAQINPTKSSLSTSDFDSDVKFAELSNFLTHISVLQTMSEDSCFENGYFECCAGPARVYELLWTIPLLDHRSTYRNHARKLRCGCQYGPAIDRRCAFDTSSASQVRRCTVFESRHTSRMGRDVNNRACFSCETNGGKVVVRGISQIQFEHIALCE